MYTVSGLLILCICTQVFVFFCMHVDVWMFLQVMQPSNKSNNVHHLLARTYHGSGGP